MRNGAIDPPTHVLLTPPLSLPNALLADLDEHGINRLDRKGVHKQEAVQDQQPHRQDRESHIFIHGGREGGRARGSHGAGATGAAAYVSLAAAGPIKEDGGLGFLYEDGGITKGNSRQDGGPFQDLDGRKEINNGEREGASECRRSGKIKKSLSFPSKFRLVAVENNETKLFHSLALPFP